MVRANLSRQAANFLGQRQMASLSKQGKGKFRRRPASRENSGQMAMASFRYGKGQRTKDSGQMAKEKLLAHGKLRRGQAAWKLPSRQMARASLRPRQTVNFLGQRQMANLSKQGTGKFRRRPAARENFVAARENTGQMAMASFRRGKWQMATGKSVAAKYKGLRSNGKGKRKVPVYGKANLQGKLAAVSDPSSPAVTRHATARQVQVQVCGFNVAVHRCDDERLTTARPAVAAFLYPLVARGRLLPANHSTS